MIACAVAGHTEARLCLKSQKSLLDRVSTGSDSDLVSDQHVIFLMILDPPWCDQVAIAPCTDPIQVRFRLLRQSPEAIVSGDSHLLDLKQYQGIRIVTAAELVAEIQLH